MPKVPQTINAIQVCSRTCVIKKKLNAIPNVATTGNQGVLYGRSRLGSFTRSNQTAPHTMANANSVPMEHISETVFIGVVAPTIDTMKPTKIVLRYGVLYFG